jgi:hypothetical protein
MYNEPNLSTFWTPEVNVSNYILLALATGEAIKSVTPNEISTFFFLSLFTFIFFYFFVKYMWGQHKQIFMTCHYSKVVWLEAFWNILMLYQSTHTGIN